MLCRRAPRAAASPGRAASAMSFTAFSEVAMELMDRVGLAALDKKAFERKVPTFRPDEGRARTRACGGGRVVFLEDCHKPVAYKIDMKHTAECQKFLSRFF